MDNGCGIFQLYSFDMRKYQLITMANRETPVSLEQRGTQKLFFTKRNGKDTDIYTMNPDDPASANLRSM